MSTLTYTCHYRPLRLLVCARSAVRLQLTDHCLTCATRLVRPVAPCSMVCPVASARRACGLAHAEFPGPVTGGAACVLPRAAQYLCGRGSSGAFGLSGGVLLDLLLSRAPGHAIATGRGARGNGGVTERCPSGQAAR